jgi:hypothetical protein
MCTTYSSSDSVQKKNADMNTLIDTHTLTYSRGVRTRTRYSLYELDQWYVLASKRAYKRSESRR